MKNKLIPIIPNTFFPHLVRLFGTLVSHLKRDVKNTFSFFCPTRLFGDPVGLKTRGGRVNTVLFSSVSY
jgi:hypothetical protein